MLYQYLLNNIYSNLSYYNSIYEEIEGQFLENMNGKKIRVYIIKIRLKL